MADWESKLQTLLSDPKAMEQIMGIANALENGPGVPPEDKPPKAAPSGPPSPPCGDGELQGDAGALLSLLTGGQGEGPDPKTVAALFRVFSQARDDGDERRTALLAALRPYLRAERAERMDQAVRITRLSRSVRAALRVLREGGGGIV